MIALWSKALWIAQTPSVNLHFRLDNPAASIIYLFSQAPAATHTFVYIQFLY
jgi:hypothetical protein